LEGLQYTDHGDGTAEISGYFDSAWSPPIAAYEQLAADFDSCYIEASYFEPGVAFVGHWNSESGEDHYDIDPDAEDMGIPEYLEEEWNVSSWFEPEEEMS
jgi:hypothetical protein